MSTFIFQANPKSYDIDSYFSSTNYIYWSIDKLYQGRPGDVAIGDKIYFWRTMGKEPEKSGFFAEGKVVEAPTSKINVRHPDLLGEKYWREDVKNEKAGVKVVGVKISDYRVLEKRNLVSRGELVKNTKLSGLNVVKGIQGMVFRFSDDFLTEFLKLWNAENAKKLVLFGNYERKDISNIFDPDLKFTRGAGKWGVSGIVKVDNDVVFIVTLEKPHEGNPYEDSLSDDGLLNWKTQTRMSIDDDFVQRLIGHDHNASNIHLFLRYNKKDKYSYLGLLRYEWHNESSSNPVHFKWRLNNSVISEKLNDLFDSSNLVHNSPLVSGSDDFDPAKFLLKEEKNGGKLKERTPTDYNNQREVSSIDRAAADERNAKLGSQGELLILHYEKNELLKAGRADLAEKVIQISEINCAAGYDILSFNFDGSEKYIEVKTTKGGKNTNFYISENEVKVSRVNGEKYFIYRVYNFDMKNKTYQFFIQKGVVDMNFILSPISYRAAIL